MFKIRIILFISCFIFNYAAHAESLTAQKEAAIIKVIDTAVEQQRNFATCLSLDTLSRTMIKDGRKMLAKPEVS